MPSEQNGKKINTKDQESKQQKKQQVKKENDQLSLDGYGPNVKDLRAIDRLSSQLAKKNQELNNQVTLLAKKNQDLKEKRDKSDQQCALKSHENIDLQRQRKKWEDEKEILSEQKETLKKQTMELKVKNADLRKEIELHKGVHRGETARRGGGDRDEDSDQEKDKQIAELNLEKEQFLSASKKVKERLRERLQPKNVSKKDDF